ncbi:MAG: hypothetical protein ABI716_03805 [Candidatus Saccharibacteria bacterium]
MIDKISEKLFAQIDALGPDEPGLRAIEQSLELEMLLNADDNDPEDELTAITLNDLEREAIAQLDVECPHLFKQALVSGLVKRAYFDDMSQKFETEDVTFDREPVTSFGYGTLAFGSDIEGKTIKKVGHLFLIETMPPSNDTPPLVDYVPRLFGFAPTGQVEIEYDMDNETNIAFVQKHIPDILDEVDNLIFNAPTQCASLLSLGDVVISREQDIPGDVLSGLVSYVRHRLSLDTIMPYKIEVDGAVYDTTGDSLDIAIYGDDAADGELVGYVTDLTLRPYPEVTDQDVWLSDDLHWCVDVAVLEKDSLNRVAVLSIPIENILSLRSIRDMLYDK